MYTMLAKLRLPLDELPRLGCLEALGAQPRCDRSLGGIKGCIFGAEGIRI